MIEPEQLIPRHGGYRKLKSFQVAQLVYDMTVRFCDRYLEKRSRARTDKDKHRQARTLSAAALSMSVSVRPCASVPPSAELAANAALSLLNLRCYLLDRQLASQAAAFVKEGGFTERLYRVRSERRICG